ncbi:xanthine dehydrogenase family protein molybdopterin-binding subunit [Spirosoma sp. BT702]|uniref:Xanthine dehydrogenase family protein molybdopterin-binding subunit n=1 Tax=Spirosoma profusum TaxID=2771354 RepID=A0A926XZM1_9BACT|nr:xanthine dehydrogenase family protein molybdopterin-binding subunit [Spirosoma profusum]MBD2703732.1 xanthine dehydrogenase family protein molybdopterin-binding subunit [Spirosoma profusum]
MKIMKEISRRNFIRQTSLSGIALTLGASVSGKTAVEIINAQTPDKMGTELMSWISIDKSGKVTIVSHRSEMGQGTYQAIPQMIAEELEVNLDQVTIFFAPANPKKYGPQPQEGSFSVRGWYKQLLQVGASAREMLIDVATKRWNVATSECYAKNGDVIHRPSGKKLGYGLLVEEAATLTPPQNVELKSRKAYKIIGKPLRRQDIPLKINGTAQFGLDKKLPGMLYAVVERSPRFRGKVKRFDDSKTKAIPGVKQVLTVKRAVFGSLFEGVAVVADSLWAALQGRKVLVVEWDDSGFDHPGSEQLASQMRENLKKPGPSPQFEAAFENATKKLEAVYETPYQSHSCMEPLNCIAHVQDNRIEIWGPIQEANWIQADLSERMGIPKENVTVNMTFLGGGFGRKAFPDYPHEAALISKAINAPVQVVWTREDDMRLGPFRPGAFYACRGGIDNKGQIQALQTITATQWLGEGWSPEPYPDPKPAGYNSGSLEGMPSPYFKAIPHYSFGGVGTRSPIPVMWWRAPMANTAGFAGESFVDELAHLAGQDPMDFRRSHLPDKRFQALLDQLEAISNWKSRGKNAGWGVAITECFGGICGHIVQVVRKTDGKLNINKVIALIDCGWYVNPDIIRAQVEGSIIMGLGAAIKHATTFNDGKAVHQNFNTYEMPRMTDTPEIEVHIMENDEPAGGVGEPGLPPFAPALCNAIFDLTGKRIRTLPFKLEEV